MLAYYGTQISPNQTQTGEGFLICRNVPIARTGEMEYLAGELQLDGDPERVVRVYREAEDVFEAEAMASFEGKPVTDGHPPENVGPENFSAYARGHVQNVRREGDFLLADLYINDAALACDVRGGGKREVSCGYFCVYTPEGGRYRQSSIRGNHVAVVPRGRAGHAVAIKDAAQGAGKGRTTMNKFAQAILEAFGMAAKEAKDEQEMRALVATTATALDADPTAAPGEKEGEPPANDGAAAQDGAEQPPKGEDLGSKLDKILEMLGALQHREEKKPEAKGGAGIDGLIAELGSGGQAAVVPAGGAGSMDPAARDAMAELLKKVRPAVAGIRDEQDRARVVDALTTAVKGPDMVGRLMEAAEANAKKAADAAQGTSFEARCRQSEAAYAARNPHKKKED